MRALLQTCGVLAVLATTAAAFGQDQMPWQPNLETAQRVASETNRLVLIHFWAPWCRPCVRLEKEVFSKAETAKGLEANFVFVKLNADDAPGTTRLYGVSSLPTDVITTSGGRMVSQIQSPPSATQYIAQMNQAAEGHRSLARRPERPNVQQAAPPPGSGASYAPAATPAAAATSAYQQPTVPQNAPSSNDRYAEYFPQQQSQSPPANTQYGQVMPAQAYGTPPAATSPAPVDPYGAPAGQPPAVDPYAAPPVSQSPPVDPYGAPATAPPPVVNPYAAPPATNPYAGSPPTAQQPVENPYAAPAAAPPATNPYAAAPPTAQQPVVNPYAAPAAAPPATNPYAAAPPAAQQPPAANPYLVGSAAAAPTAQPPAATTAQAPYNAQQPSTAPVSNAPSTAAQLPPGCPPMGLDGNCPVTLVERKRWVLGHQAYGAVHRGRTYLFIGPQEKEKFLADPDRYSPVLSGVDPVLALDNQTTVPGRREFGVFGADGHIYLFADENSRARFEANEQAYANRAQQASQTQYQAMRPGP